MADNPLQNPTKAIDAILDSDKKIELDEDFINKVKSKSIILKPMSIGRYALLELVDCPFIKTQDADFSISNIIPSIYIMQAEIEDLCGFSSKNIDELKKKAFMWSEQFTDFRTLPKMIDEIGQQMMLIFDLAPNSTNEEGESSGKKHQTAG